MSEYAYDARHQESNALAVAGFICSLVGFVFTAGLLCPLGLILSLIALSKPGGRGWAVAGIIIGLLGTCGGVIFVLVFAAAILAALGIGAAAVFLAMHDPDRLELTVEMAQIAQAVEMEKEQSGYLPATLSSLQLDQEVLTDPWGNAYVYTFVDDDLGYDVISNGLDGQAGTTDDVHLSKLDEMWMDFIEVTEDKDSGTVSFRVGDRTVKVRGDDESGRVTIESGDRTINLVGDNDGGRITVTHDQTVPDENEPQPEESSSDSE